MNAQQLEQHFLQYSDLILSSKDSAHDFLHLKRVVKTAKMLCEAEGAKLEVVLPAAWLHDLVVVPKNDPRRKEASKMAATAAIDLLSDLNYRQDYYEEIAHAIEAHSFSAGIETKTLEAQIVQDADRLDALGAVGIARCFATAGLLNRPFYCEQDPFCEKREPDDSEFTVDHFYVKLLHLVESLKTKAGRIEGEKRLRVMRSFLRDLQDEIL